MYSRILPKLILHKDICKLEGDGNPGAFNVFHHCGVPMGLLCLFLDALKGFAPVFAATFLLDPRNFLFGLVMAAPVLGHAVGLFNRFRGGKCITTSFGVVIGAAPASLIFLVLAVLYILFSTVIKIDSHTARSILTFALFGGISLPVLCIRGIYGVAAGCLFLSVIAIVKHIPHASVTVRGEEPEESEQTHS